MTTMRWVVDRWLVGCVQPIFSFARAVRPMRTTRLPILVWFMVVPVRAMANKTYA
jgi:hypothetical protein